MRNRSLLSLVFSLCPLCLCGSILISFKPLALQKMMIVLREPMGLVADVLEQTQRRRVPAQAQRFFFAGTVDLFLTLRQRDQTGWLNAHEEQGFPRGVELAATAID